MDVDFLYITKLTRERYQQSSFIILTKYLKDHGKSKQDWHCINNAKVQNPFTIKNHLCASTLNSREHQITSPSPQLVTKASNRLHCTLRNWQNIHYYAVLMMFILLTRSFTARTTLPGTNHHLVTVNNFRSVCSNPSLSLTRSHAYTFTRVVQAQWAMQQ